MGVRVPLGMTGVSVSVLAKVGAVAGSVRGLLESLGIGGRLMTPLVGSVSVGSLLEPVVPLPV